MINAEMLKEWGNLSISAMLLFIGIVALIMTMKQFNRVEDRHIAEREKWQEANQNTMKDYTNAKKESTEVMRALIKSVENQTMVLSTVECANFRKVASKIM